jgi:tetratricopeptide (TPR) repeat protein
LYKFPYLFLLASLCCSASGYSQNKGELSNQEQVIFASKYITADKERVLGNFQEAFKLCATCLEMDQQNDAVHYQLGRLFKQQNNLPKAEYFFERAMKLDPSNKWYYQELALVQADQQNFKGAAKTYANLRKKYPENADFILNHANFLLLSNDVKNAMKTYDEYESLAGKNPDVSLRKYRYYVGVEKYEAAALEMQSLINAYPDDPQLYGYLAELYQAQGKTEQALEVYESALKADPNNAYIQLSLAEYYERTRQSDTAFAYLQKAYSNVGLDIDTKIGVLLRMYPQAERDPLIRARTIVLCDNLALAHPLEAKSFSVTGDFLYLDGQFESARASYYQAIELDPSRYVIWNQVLIIDSELNDDTAMLEDSKKALELFPTQPGLYLFNGIANNQQKHYSEAAKSLRSGSQLVIGNPLLSAQLLASLGDALHELRRHKSSDSAYAESLVFDPENLYVLNNYSYFLSLRKIDLEKAKEMSGKTFEKEPTNASYLDTYGWVLFQLQEFIEAEVLLKKSLENGGLKSPEVLEHYGDTLFKLNQIEEAVTYWKMALAAGSESLSLNKKIESKSINE